MLPALVAALVPAAGSASPEHAQAMLGAASPRAGAVVASAGAGMLVLIPHATVGGRIGTGAGTRIELAYRNLAVLGHGGTVRFGWGRAMGSSLVLGAALRSAIMTLRLIPSGFVGIDFADSSLGNEWTAGADVLVTWQRAAAAARVTASLGPTVSLATPRTDSPDARGLVVNPFLRALAASIAGEWPLGEGRALFLKLDALVLLRARIRPLGFLPTVTAGLAWGWGA